MNILAIETASASCSVALYLSGKVEHLTDATPHSHTRKILPMIDSLLGNNNLCTKDIDIIAFDSGPGSFTGLRIGTGVVQGLAIANKTPVIKVSSLEAMAYQSCATNIAVALDARMQEVYFATFKKDGERIVSLSKPEVLNVSSITIDVDINWTLIGNGWCEYGIPKHLRNFPYENDKGTVPHARGVAIIAAYNYKNTLNYIQALPEYIREV